MTSEEIGKLARDIVTNTVYFTADGREIQDSFGFILSLAVPDWSDEFIETVGAAWAPWTAAAPTAINGHPFMTSMSLVHVADVPRVLARVQAALAALGESAREEPEQSGPQSPGSDGDDVGAAEGAL
jgi:hypothetical protein